MLMSYCHDDDEDMMMILASFCHHYLPCHDVAMFQATDKGHYGTVTGAMLAGCREGARLAELWSKK